MESSRSTRLGLWIEGLAYGIGVVGCVLAGVRSGAAGFFVLAGAAGILGVLVIWKARELSVSGAAIGTPGERTAESILAAAAIALVVLGVWMTVGL